MAFSLRTSISLQTIQSSRTSHRLYPVYLSPSNLLLPRHSLATSSTVTFSRRRNNGSTITSSSSNEKQKNLSNKEARKKEDEIDEDAFDSLFNMLEEDLKNDELSISQGNDGDDDEDNDDDGNDVISGEDLEKLQSELEEAFGVGGDDDADVRICNSAEDEVENGDGDEEEEEEKRPVVLKNWQLRRLARALKTGRRKISIKSLAGDVCLDRAYVLDLLRDPPPNLVMMSAALPDEPAPRVVMPDTKTIVIAPEETTTSVDTVKSESEVKVPVHEMRHSWIARKRLKKVQVDTLERIYRKTKRPTNTMISSIVHVTNLPRKRVVKWFEDKRAEEGVPAHRVPYQRSGPETVSSC